MAIADRKMLVFRDELRRKLIDSPTSFEEQSDLIKLLKVGDSTHTYQCQNDAETGSRLGPSMGLHYIVSLLVGELSVAAAECSLEKSNGGRATGGTI